MRRRNRNGIEYVSTMEGIKYPYFGTQWCGWRVGWLMIGVHGVENVSSTQAP